MLSRGNQGFPKSVRLLRSKDFRRVYDGGKRYSCRLFTAFCVCETSVAGPRIGFTTPKALGNAVVRNRIPRRTREVVRAYLAELNPQWSVVINPRRKAFDCNYEEIENEIEKFFRWVNAL